MAVVFNETLYFQYQINMIAKQTFFKNKQVLKNKQFKIYKKIIHYLQQDLFKLAIKYTTKTVCNAFYQSTAT